MEKFKRRTMADYEEGLRPFYDRHPGLAEREGGLRKTEENWVRI